MLNQVTLVSDIVFSVVTPVAAVTPYNGAAYAATTRVFRAGYSGYKLTLQGLDNILGSLSNMKVEFSSSFRKGFNRPLSNVVFYCPQKIKAVSIRLFSMVGCIGQPLWLVVPFRDTANSIQSATQCLAAAGSGLHPQKRHTAMNTSTGETTPQFQQLFYELESIETLSLQSNNFTCQNPRQILADIFQHSQKALNLLHDLKNLRA